MKSLFLFLFFGLFYSYQVAFSQLQSSMPEESRLLRNKLPTDFKFKINKTPISIVVVPILFYEPRTTLGAGVISASGFNVGGGDTRLSSISLYGSYTLRQQIITNLKNFIYFKNNTYILRGEAGFDIFDEDVYGLGGLTPHSYRDNVSYTHIKIVESLLRRYRQTNNYFGVSFFLESFDNINFTHFIRKTIEQDINRPFLRNTLGLTFIHDSRDNINNTYKGSYLDLEIRTDVGFLGATQEASELVLDYRYFYPLFAEKNHILAFRFYCHYGSENLPYLALPRSEEYGTGRGFGWGRYRNNFLTSIETSYKFPLFPKSEHWILGGLQMNIFAGITFINEKIGQFLPVTPLPSIGFGFRYTLDKESRIAARADLGVGANNNMGFYLDLNEAY